MVLVGTVTATPGQADLVNALLATGKPVVSIALRTPYDLASYPGADTHICTYGAHQPSLSAAAAAIFGSIPFQGRLPVSIPGLYPIDHGLGV